MPEPSTERISPTGFTNPFIESFFKPRSPITRGSDASQPSDVQFFPDGTILMGPILQFRGTRDEHRYCISILVLAIGQEAPILAFNRRVIKSLPRSLLYKRTPSGHETNLWRYDVEMKQRIDDVIYEYEIKSPYFHLQQHPEGGGESNLEVSEAEDEEGTDTHNATEDSDALSERTTQEGRYNRKYRFIVPGETVYPFLGSLSCNNQSKEAQPFTELWEKLHKSHLEHGLHLLLHTGDQIYSDPYIWNCHKKLNNFLKRFRKSKVEFTQDMRDALDDFYFETYVRYWTIPEVAKVLAEIPSIMMWDDHDIFDGYGSYRTSWQRTNVFQGIFTVAQKYFIRFQLGMTEGEQALSSLRESPGLTQVYTVNEVAIISLDNRRERSRRRIMSDETYHSLSQHLNSLEDIKHVIVIIGVPIVYNSFYFVERLISGFNVEIEDDVRDHWRSWRHHEERKVFIRMLQRFSKVKKWRTTFIAGDVHLGCAGVIHNKYEKAGNATTINMLVSSGIGSKPPPNILLRYLKFTSLLKDHISKKAHIVGGLHEFDDGSVYLNQKRNFLLLFFEANGGLLSEWQAEGTGTKWHLRIRPYSETETLDYSYAKLKRGKENDIEYEEGTKVST